MNAFRKGTRFITRGFKKKETTKTFDELHPEMYATVTRTNVERTKPEYSNVERNK